GVRAVVDARAGGLAEAGRIGAPVGHAGGHDERTGLDLPRPIEEHRAHWSTRLEAHDVAGQDHLGAKAGSLSYRTPGQVGAGQPLREPEVVLDRRALTGLAAGRLTLHGDGA